MAEAILPHIHCLKVPLPNNPLKELNSYIITGSDRNLIIDTGFNRLECKEALFSGLDELEIDLNKTDLFITHLHADHSGLATALVSDNNRVYCSKVDSIAINESSSQNYWLRHGSYFKSYGFPLESLEKAIGNHPGQRYCTQFELDFTIVSEGSPVIAGDYCFRVVETPGHTPGHLCLYEPAKKLLIAGDHILDDITPNISIWEGMPDALGAYLQSLQKVSRLEVDLVLPAHRSLIDDHRRRIAELEEHHQIRLNEVLNILNNTENGEADAYETASKMTWDLTYSTWEEFPIQQKWFACGEAAAHLDYLAARHLAKKRLKNGRFVFSRI